MAVLSDGMPVWWLAGVCATLIVAVLVSMSAGILGNAWKGTKEEKVQEDEGGKHHSSSNGATGQNRRPRKERDDDDVGPLEKELWVPKLEEKSWQEASQLSGCPWNFEGCDSVESALDCIWRQPLAKELQGAFDALKQRVKDFRVARITIPWQRQTHFVVVYTLRTGAELFGGAPSDLAVGLNLGPDLNEDSDDDAIGGGLRRRRGGGRSPQKEEGFKDSPCILPCLVPFYRIHDGFGVLLSPKHLALIAADPEDYAKGSCYYVYPERGLTPIPGTSLVKFARVDKNCAACADVTAERAQVVYVERTDTGPKTTEDDEPIMEFVADTICNIAGKSVVPPPYMGGPGSQFAAHA